MNETCWFCQRREADPSTIKVVKMKKDTILKEGIGSISVKTDYTKIPIPRCSQCASGSKKDNSMILVVTITILLSGPVSCLILTRIPYNIPEWFPVFAGIALPVVLFALYIVWVFKRGKNLTSEQRQDYIDATKAINEHPTVSLLLKQGWQILRDASEMEM